MQGTEENLKKKSVANVGSEIKKTLHQWNKNRSEWNIQRTRKETQKLKIQQIKYQKDSKVEKNLPENT